MEQMNQTNKHCFGEEFVCFAKGNWDYQKLPWNQEEFLCVRSKAHTWNN
jgi:hypothetical protein